ncbi:hypothetical protein [Halomonas chromatireducens]|uniref:Uncharacterized protein n=1 Tax=Halomonas chromatireducens TaxID=507626 RepID=A0A120JWP0_9GAMM|nr:hypothetical protein [Halomonas chromatireducens]AMD02262.1 hypothetical protein LOKO_03216 [Halomonas chromatireducens]
MADTTSRLDAIKEGIRKLANLAGGEQAEAARQLAAKLSADVDALAPEVAAQPPAPPRPGKGPAITPLHGEIRCPVCALRSFTYQKGTMRESADANTGFEAFYHCLSCGHQAWHEAALD